MKSTGERDHYYLEAMLFATIGVIVGIFIGSMLRSNSHPTDCAAITPIEKLASQMDICTRTNAFTHDECWKLVAGKAAQ